MIIEIKQSPNADFVNMAVLYTIKKQIAQITIGNVHLGLLRFDCSPRSLFHGLISEGGGGFGFCVVCANTFIYNKW